MADYNPDDLYREIANYEYHSIDDSVIAPIYSKIMEIPMMIIPKAISPNFISLCGLFLVLVGMLFVETNPVITGLTIVLYHMCDTLDGKQGRRLGMENNPTTELFDHGVDSIVSLTVSHNISRLFDLDITIEVFIIVIVFSIFFISTCENSKTHLMHFKDPALNPTEILLVVESIFILHPLYQPLISDNFILCVGLVVCPYLIFKIINEFLLLIGNFDRPGANSIIVVSALCLLFPVNVMMCGLSNGQSIFSIIVGLNIIIICTIWIEISKFSFNFLLPFAILLNLIIGVTYIPNFVLLLSMLVATGMTNINFGKALLMSSLFGLVLYLDLTISFLLCAGYLIMFYEFNNIICQVLGMDHFFSIPLIDSD